VCGRGVPREAMRARIRIAIVILRSRASLRWAIRDVLVEDQSPQVLGDKAREMIEEIMDSEEFERRAQTDSSYQHIRDIITKETEEGYPV